MLYWTRNPTPEKIQSLLLSCGAILLDKPSTKLSFSMASYSISDSKISSTISSIKVLALMTVTGSIA
jgi:hypothetical protein